MKSPKPKSLKRNFIFQGLLFIVLLCTNVQLKAQFPNIANYKNRPLALTFLTTAQSIMASNCSGVASVQTSTMSGSPKVVAANLSVNLTATGAMTFYSDSFCTNVMTSVVIGIGTSSSNFYFIDDAAGADTITAAASGYTSALQTETVSTNPFVWMGGGGNTSWSTGGNWSGGAAPGAGDRAVFNSACVTNCSPNVTSNISVAGLRVSTGYGGTITQNSGFTMTIGAAGWVHTAGTFAGGDSTILNSGLFRLTGGSWTSTSGLLQISGGSCLTQTLISKTGGTFSHHNGTTKFTGGSSGYCWGSYLISGTSAFNFYHLHFDSPSTVYGNGSYFSADQTLNVAGNLIIQGSAGATQVDTATINVSGNISQLAGAIGGSATINVVGNAAQTYIGTVTGKIPKIVVNTTGTFSPDVGVTTFAVQSLAIQQGTVTAPTGILNIAPAYCDTATIFNQTGGSFVNNNGTLQLTGGSSGYCQSFYSVASTGAINLKNLKFENEYSLHGLGGGSNFSANQTLNIAGDLTVEGLQGYAAINSTTINLSGNAFALAGAAGGSATINIVGNGTQKYTGAAAGFLPNVVVNTTGTFSSETGNTEFGVHSLTVTQGAFTAPTGTLRLVGGDMATESTFTLNGGTFAHNNGTALFTGKVSSWSSSFYSIVATAAINFYNLSFDNYSTNYGNGSNYSANQQLNVANNLRIGAQAGVTAVNSSTINVSGNVSLLAGCNGGTALINYVGNSTQTFSQAGGAVSPTGNVTVNQTAAGNISLASNLTSASTNWSVTAGTINMNGYNFTSLSLALGGTTIYRQNGAGSPGTLTVGGSTYTPGAFLGGTVAN